MADSDAQPRRRAHRLDRFRAPLMVAAGAAVLAAGVILVIRSTGELDGHPVAGPRPIHPATTPPSVIPVALPIPPLNAAQAAEDLDRCARIAGTSPRAAEFPPRQQWQPVFAVELDGHRITAFLAPGRPMFCEVTAHTATVSDPTAPPMRMKPAGDAAVDFAGLYLSPVGILAGEARGMARLECVVGILDETHADGTTYQTHTETASLRDNLFVVHVGQLKDGDQIVTTAYDGSGRAEGGGGMLFERSRIRPVGASGIDRP